MEKSPSESEKNGAFAVVDTLPLWFFRRIAAGFCFLRDGKKGHKIFYARFAAKKS